MLDVLDQVGDPLRVVQVEEHADVPELEVEVDQGHLGLGLVGHGDRQVGGDQGLAHPPLARVEEEDLAVLGPAGAVGGLGARGLVLRSRGLGQEGLLLLLQLVDPPDAGDELVPAEGLDQELAGARLHGPPEVVPLPLDRHDDDRGVGHLLGQDLGRLDAVHDRHVDVHQDDVGAQLAGLLHPLLAVGGGAHDLDVGLEGQQLLQVVQGARDVVDDQDLDQVSHGLSGASAPLLI